MTQSSYPGYVKDYQECARCGSLRPVSELKPSKDSTGICNNLDYCYRAFVETNGLQGSSVEVVEGIIRERQLAREALRRMGVKPAEEIEAVAGKE